MFEGVLGVLAFFTTLLVLGTGAVLLVIALLKRNLGRAWKIGRLCLGWVLAYLAVLLLVSFTSRPRSIPLGQERCFDEMCYSVQAVSTAHTLATASGPLSAQGDYLLLTLQLRSEARRTAQHPSEPSLMVLDADGRQFPGFLDAASGQPLTAYQLWGQAVQPGETQTHQVAFDLPVGTREPKLVMGEGVGAISGMVIGDENSPFHARTLFLLKR